MSPDPVDLAEAALASEDPRTLYADLTEDWDDAYRDMHKLATRTREIADDAFGDQPDVAAHIKGQSDGLFMAMRILREKRPAPEIDEDDS